MRRREFIAFAAAATCRPAVVRAQPSKRVPIIIVLTPRSPEALRRQMAAFLGGLKDAGLQAGRDFDFVHRSIGLSAARVPEIIAKLVELGPAVIVTQDTPLTIAAKKATQTVPIVGAFISNPVGFGLAASIAHPGGNVTGLLSHVDKLVAKQLEFLLKVAPSASRIGILANSDNPANVGGVRVLEADAPQLAFLTPAVRNTTEIDSAFEAFAQRRADAVFVFQDSLFSDNEEKIATLALKAHLPTIFGFRQSVEAGGLMSYGLNVVRQWRSAGGYAAKILAGANPADLPIEIQPRLELVINLKTAKTLGLVIPPAVLALAQDVIE
jgi:putative ABC transport system substrate-binding protein